VLTPPTALSFSVSKVGCVLAGCCYGRPTDGWWGVALEHMHTRTVETTVPVRFLEMGAAAAMGALALLLLTRPRPRWRLREGTIFAAFLTAAALARFGFGFLRGGYEIRMGSLDAVQWGGLVLGLLGAGLLGFLLATRKRSEAGS
jgi:phosphatidylglycerol:prolipoprotein diacylglycerol transferase